MKRIDFETAKIAKQLGYYNPGFDGYDENGKYYNFYLDGMSKEFFDACYQAELQEWLRNEHNIHINIISCYTTKYQYKFEVWSLKSLIDIEGWLSYEDCLEAALQEALKLLINKTT